MLKHPGTHMPFEPKLSYVLAGISIYDKEETLGESLWTYNPNKRDEREEIIKKFIIPDFKYLSYRHRFLTFKLLESFLDKPDFDFATQYESDYDEPRTIAWDETEIEDPRGFFEEIYKIASEEWKEDLHKASLEDQSDW